MADSSPPGRKCMSLEWRAILQLGAAVFCIFAAYMPAANLASSLEKQIGYYANAATYTFSVIGAPLAVVIVRRSGARVSFAVGSLPYAFFVLANWALNAGVMSWPVYVFAASLNGLGGALLWTGLGVYTNDAARSWSATLGAAPTAHLGRFNAIPWALQFVASALSQLACGFLLPKFSAQIVFLALTFVALAGFVIALGLPLVAPPTNDVRSSNDAPSRGIYTLLRSNPVSRWFIPVFLAHGFNQGFMFGTLPATATDWLSGSVAAAAMVMAFNSVADCAAAMGLGRLSDTVGFKYTLLSTATCDAVAALLLVVFADADFGSQISWLTLLVLAGLFACADAGWQTQGSAGIGCLLPNDEGPAFSLMVILKGVGTATSFFLGPLLSLRTKALVLLGSIIFGMVAAAALPSGTSARCSMLHDDVPEPLNTPSDQ